MTFTDLITSYRSWCSKKQKKKPRGNITMNSEEPGGGPSTSFRALPCSGQSTTEPEVEPLTVKMEPKRIENNTIIIIDDDDDTPPASAPAYSDISSDVDDCSAVDLSQQSHAASDVARCKAQPAPELTASADTSSREISTQTTEDVAASDLTAGASPAVQPPTSEAYANEVVKKLAAVFARGMDRLGTSNEPERRAQLPLTPPNTTHGSTTQTQQTASRSVQHESSSRLTPYNSPTSRVVPDVLFNRQYDRSQNFEESREQEHFDQNLYNSGTPNSNRNHVPRWNHQNIGDINNNMPHFRNQNIRPSPGRVVRGGNQRIEQNRIQSRFQQVLANQENFSLESEPDLMSVENAQQNLNSVRGNLEINATRDMNYYEDTQMAQMPHTYIQERVVPGRNQRVGHSDIQNRLQQLLANQDSISLESEPELISVENTQQSLNSMRGNLEINATRDINYYEDTQMAQMPHTYSRYAPAGRFVNNSNLQVERPMLSFGGQRAACAETVFKAPAPMSRTAQAASRNGRSMSMVWAPGSAVLPENRNMQQPHQQKNFESDRLRSILQQAGPMSPMIMPVRNAPSCRSSSVMWHYLLENGAQNTTCDLCGRVCKSQRGLKIHQNKCRRDH